MKISEKQIMQLITIARSFAEMLKAEGMAGEVPSYTVIQLLDKINNQQSEELKEID